MTRNRIHESKNLPSFGGHAKERLLSRNGQKRFLAFLAALSLLAVGCDEKKTACEASFGLNEDWGGGYNAQVRIRNSGEASWDDWTVEFDTDPDVFLIEAAGASAHAEDGRLVFKSQKPGETIRTDDSINFSYSVTASGDRRTPISISLNDTMCSSADGSFMGPGGIHATMAEPAAATSVGVIEVQGGIARFFVDNAPWADLHVESGSISRAVRMAHHNGQNEYPVHGLSPGDRIDFRFLVGIPTAPGQVFSKWFEYIYTGIDGASATGSTPRVRPLEDGRLEFSVEDVPFAEVHVEINGEFTARRLTVDGTRHATIFSGLASGDVIVYRWVVGLNQAPGQYDTDWRTYIYERGDATLPPTEENPAPSPEPPSEAEPNRPPETEPPASPDPEPEPGAAPETEPGPEPPSVPAPDPGAENDPDVADTGRWQLVWADEFDASSGTSPSESKWGFDLGGSGFGNAEHQYYTDRPENAATDGEGNLVITARKESLAGSSCWYGTCLYTSSRLVTKGLFEQQYGRIEIRAQLPAGQGLWPAFWMLGNDIDAVGWPHSGEIDIVENIGREPSTVHGTLHGPGYSGGGGIGGSFSLPDGGRFSEGFHTFAIEWEPDSIRWFVDGQHSHTLTPSDLPSGTTWVFDHPFFLLLNVAVGGQWPGYPDESTTFPQQMVIDFVRVYEDISQDENQPRSAYERIEAEAFDQSFGVQIEATQDDGGGSNIGWIADGDWALYRSIDFEERNTAELLLRVASDSEAVGKAVVRLDAQDGPVLAERVISSTGGWQSWQTVQVPLLETPSGIRNLHVSFESPGEIREFANINWLQFVASAPGEDSQPVPPDPAAPEEPAGENPNPQGGNGGETDEDQPQTDADDSVADPGQNPSETSLTAIRNSLYLQGANASGVVGELSTTPGTGGFFVRLPGDRSAIAFETPPLTARYRPDLESGETTLDLWLDSVFTPGIYAQAQVLFDFDGDGTFDRSERYTAAPSHDHVGLDSYHSETFPLVDANGEYRDLEAGIVRLEIHDPYALDGPEVRVGASLREHQVSKLDLPFEFDVVEFANSTTAHRRVEWDESILCAPTGGDPRCGPGFDPSTGLPEEEVEEVIENGLAAFRFRGAHGACASCHSPDGFDLAIIGYSDADIRRRALEHVSPQQAEDIVSLMHGLRQKHDLRRLLHPENFRPLQPGFSPLPGAGPVDRDLAFLEYLRDDVRLLLLDGVIDSREKAQAAEAQLAALDLRDIRIGVRLDRWSEDQFHGPSHQGQDLTDASNVSGHEASVAEWLPNLGVTPKVSEEEHFYSLFDNYAENPTDLAFWRFYDSIRELTESEERLSGEEEERGYEFMLSKYESVQIMTHMLRHQTLDYPDRVVDRLGHDVIVDVELAVARNPIWKVGDLIRQHPLHCNHPEGCTSFPAFVPVESDPWRQEVQSRLLQRAWFWAGWATDPALLTLDESFATISGDYFYPLHHSAFRGHYAFIMAKMSVEKANAVGWEVSGGQGTAGHGKWASIRPFLVYKHSEFQRPIPAPNDPRRELQTRLMSNTARMWLYMVEADLETSGSAFDRAGTAKAVNFARLNWLDSVDPGGRRDDTEAVFTRIVEHLREAEELRQQHHTYDLYDYLPVDDVAID